MGSDPSSAVRVEGMVIPSAATIGATGVAVNSDLMRLPAGAKSSTEFDYACVNFHTLMLIELKNFRPVNADKWPFPDGVTTRLAPAYFAYIFSLFSRGDNFAWDYIKRQTLEGCVVALQLPYCLGLVDMRLKSGMSGWINWPLVEQLAKTACSIEVGFRRSKVRSDWLRPSDQQQRQKWVSKVDWRGAERIDPRLTRSSEFRLPALDKELKGEMEHAALVQSAQQRMDAITGPAVDRIKIT